MMKRPRVQGNGKRSAGRPPEPAAECLRLLMAALLLALAATTFLAARASAHDPQDAILEQVGVDEKPGGRLPLQLPFIDQGGNPVQLASYFTGKPVILTLNYYSCPTLCPLVYRNLAGSIGKMTNVALGRDFKVVSVSIDPNETLERAKDKSSKTYALLQANHPEQAWPFLMGGKPAIDQLAQSVGVRYVALKNGEFAHPNVIVIATPDGRVSRYLYGLEQAPQDLKLALLEASDGEIGTSRIFNKALLYCFHYDPVGKKYVLLASRVMTGAMMGVLLVTLGLLALLWRRERPTG